MVAQVQGWDPVARWALLLQIQDHLWGLGASNEQVNNMLIMNCHIYYGPLSISWKTIYENVPSLSCSHESQFIFIQGWEREWSGCHCSHHNWQLLRNIRSPNLFMNLFKRGENKSSLTTMTETYEVYFPVWGVVFSIRLSHGPLARNFPSKGSFQYRPPPCHRENRKIQTDLWIYINENTSLLCYIKSCFPAFSSTFSECRLSAQ